MTTNTISTLAKRTEAELADMTAKARSWIDSVGTPRARSDSEVAMAHETIAAIGREHRRRHDGIWNAQSDRSLGERAAAAFAHKPLDRHERRLLSTLLEGQVAPSGATGLHSIVSGRAAFFGPSTEDEDGSIDHALRIAEQIGGGGTTRLKLRDEVRDAVAQAVRDHDIEVERKRRMKTR